MVGGWLIVSRSLIDWLVGWWLSGWWLVVVWMGSLTAG